MPVLQLVQQLHPSQSTVAVDPQSAFQPITPVADPFNAKFSLNFIGVAGFFNGDIAVNGMATVIFFWRGWGGLYNAPGSLEMARRYGQLASARIYRGLFPGDTRDPSQLFGLDGKKGPRFLAAQSGSLFETTGHIGYLIARLARRALPEVPLRNLPDSDQSRVTTPATVTVIDLGDSQPKSVIHPDELPYPSYGLFALIPTAVSLLACVACMWVGDWWAFLSIMWGMLANGCACYVLGQGKVTFQHPKPAPNAPPGDGILWAADNAVVVILGSERAVNTVTRGRFFLQYGPLPETKDGNGMEEDTKRELNSAPEGGAPNSLLIGLSGVLLIIQFFVQLLFIPQAKTFGQLMFLLTLATSWGYNILISSIDREDIQTRILRGHDILDLPDIPKNGGEDQGTRRRAQVRVRKFEFGTWTAMATFAWLTLQRDPATPLNKFQSAKILNALIPNDTDVWTRWKQLVMEKLRSGELEGFREPNADAAPMLQSIVDDANVAFRRYREAFEGQNSSQLDSADPFSDDNVFGQSGGCPDHSIRDSVASLVDIWHWGRIRTQAVASRLYRFTSRAVLNAVNSIL